MATLALRSELPELPRKMRRLPIDPRGYPVPWFVAWLDDAEPPNEVHPGEGRAEFRVMRRAAIAEALKYERCWVCGGQLGRHRAFVIGPMCAINRINAEPPSHVECADFAGRACPFLARSHMRRRENDLPPGRYQEMPGQAILRNPGVACVWISDQPFSIKGVPNGVLFDLPQPTEVRFYAEGRVASIEQVARSIDTGLPLLLEVCVNDQERKEVHARAKSVRSLPGFPRS